MHHPDPTEIVLRIIGFALAGWTVFLAFRGVLRKAGVVPWPPFKTRAEYLEAAADMNLEEFIGRARVTPESVKRKPPKEKISALVDLMTQTDEFLKGQPEIQRVDALEEVAKAVKASVEPLVMGLAYLTMGPGSMAEICKAFEKRYGKWFRFKKTGALLRATSELNGEGYGFYQAGLSHDITVKQDEVMTAYPTDGEWWRWTKLELIDGVRTVNTAPFRWNSMYHNPDLVRKNLEVGNLEPVNFGRGEEKKSQA